MYYQAKSIAKNNGRTYHLAAILLRKGSVVTIRENTSKTHPRFTRRYPDGSYASHMHAEMNVLRFAQPGDEIEVMRFKKKTGERTMAKPCCFCEKLMRDAGIRKVRYTDWDGGWRTLSL